MNPISEKLQRITEIAHDMGESGLEVHFHYTTGDKHGFFIDVYSPKSQLGSEPLFAETVSITGDSDTALKTITNVMIGMHQFHKGYKAERKAA